LDDFGDADLGYYCRLKYRDQKAMGSQDWKYSTQHLPPMPYDAKVTLVSTSEPFDTGILEIAMMSDLAEPGAVQTALAPSLFIH